MRKIDGNDSVLLRASVTAFRKIKVVVSVKIHFVSLPIYPGQKVRLIKILFDEVFYPSLYKESYFAIGNETWISMNIIKMFRGSCCSLAFK